MDERGWSLLELLVCGAILALGALLVLPRAAQQMAERQLDYEAACLAAELRFLQDMSRDYPREELWGLSHAVAPELSIETYQYYISADGRNMLKHTAQPGVYYRYPYPTIVFSSSGDAEPMTIEIHLAESSRRVIVDRVGRIRTAGGD